MKVSAPAVPAWRLIGIILYAVLAVGLGFWLGGGAALGRLDAALLLPTLPLAAAPLVLSSRFRQVGAFAAVLLPTAALIVIAWLVLGGVPVTQWPQLAVLALASLIWLTSMRLLWRALVRRRAGLRAAILVLLAAIWWLGAHVVLGAAYTDRWAKQSGKTIMLSGLPLRTWTGGELLEGAFVDSAAVVALRKRVSRPLVLADTLVAGSLNTNDRLLLAHPPALPPEALVEIDRFVRGGGRAVILADALSGWPPPHPFGDARNPPVTSLLTPLLDHWGLRLNAPAPDSTSAGVAVVKNLGRRIELHSSGHFSVLPHNCRGAGRLPDQRYSMAFCRIGRGTAIVLADADMLFDPLWRPEPLWASHLRRSDNIEWVADQLNQPQGVVRWGLRPTWR